MQTNIVERTGTYSGCAYRGRIAGKTVAGRPGRKKKNSPRNVHRTGFLKQRFNVLPAKPDLEESILNEYFTEENFGYLLECAVRYAGLHGKTMVIPAGTTYERIHLLYYHFAEMLPEGQKLNIEINEGKMFWIIYYFHRWISHQFYWMPVSFITRLSGRIREISMSFMHCLIRTNHLTRFKHCYEYELLFEVFTENFPENCDDAEKSNLEELLYSYSEGEISVFLDEIYTRHPIHLPVALDEFIPVHPVEIKLIDCFKKGLPLISGQDSIMSYDYNPYVHCYPNVYNEYDDDFEPYSLERAIRYVYDIDDPVTGEMEQISNQHIQEMYAVEPTSCMVLKPDSDLFVPGDYPERFSDWFTEMIETIKEITGHE